MVFRLNSIINKIDNLILEIKNNKENYRKIISEIDSTLKSKNEASNITETVFKKDNELVIVQYHETIKDEISDYYFNKGFLIYIEVKNKDNTYDKTYYNEGKIIIKYVNGIKIEITDEDIKKMEAAMHSETKKLIKRYEIR